MPPLYHAYFWALASRNGPKLALTANMNVSFCSLREDTHRLRSISQKPMPDNGGKVSICNSNAKGYFCLSYAMFTTSVGIEKFDAVMKTIRFPEKGTSHIVALISIGDMILTTQITQTRLAADIGGTFTDIVLETPKGLFTAKVPTNTKHPELGVLSGADVRHFCMP